MIDEREALLVLNMLPGVGPCRKQLLFNEFGSCAEALGASVSRLERLPGIGSRLASLIAGWERHCDLAGELSRVSRAGVEVLIECDECYPPLLREISDPPICLYARGDVKSLRDSRCSLAVVGSRQTSMYGLRMADLLSRSVCYAGWPVVSGLARGIDTAAHEASLRAGGITIAVVGCGLAGIYPRENMDLSRRIVESGGCVVTEFPMLYRPDRRSFPMRNRIISGISRGTLVVEAGLKSGSLITASQALEQGRMVFAVPGPADVPYSRGCHALIKDGAKLVESFEDIADEFVLLPGLGMRGGEAPGETKSSKNSDEKLKLSGLELKLWNLLEGGEMGIDDLIGELDEDASSVLASLLSLELRHVVKQLPGKRVVRCQ